MVYIKITLIKMIAALFSGIGFFKIRFLVLQKLKKNIVYSNFNKDYSKIINRLQINLEKLNALDVGSAGGFNSSGDFNSKYNQYFKSILIEPNSNEIKLKKKYYKALWSEKCFKKFYILKNKNASSFYEPDIENFKIAYKKNPQLVNEFKVTNVVEAECDTISNVLNEKNIIDLDYLTIITQGSELEILKGMQNYQPLLIKVQAFIFPLYKNLPNWTKLVDYLYSKNYILISSEDIGHQVTQEPFQKYMIFIPNFTNKSGISSILERENKFIFLLLIFGQIELLKIISKNLNFKFNNEIQKLKDSFFN